MSKKIADTEELQGVKKRFLEDLDKLGKMDIPVNVRDFLLLMKNIEEDPEMLQTLRDEIIKNYGQ